MGGTNPTRTLATSPGGWGRGRELGRARPGPAGVPCGERHPRGAGPRLLGPDHLDYAAREHLPSHGEPDARPAGGGEPGRAGESEPRSERGGGLGSGRPTYMEVIFLEMSVMLMLAFPLLFPESCPSRRGKRFPSSGRRQLISVLLQTQFAGQASTEPT